MNSPIPESSVKVRRTTGGAGSRYSGACGAALAAMMLLLWTASTAACGISVAQDSTTYINGDVTTDCVEIASGGRLVITDTGTLTLTGDPNSVSTINGWIDLDDCGARLVFSADHTLSGSGYIAGHCGTARVELLNAITLTVSSGFTIQGALEIRAGSGTLDNDGLVEANHCCAGNTTLTCYSGTFTGSGEYKVSVSGCTLKLDLGISDTNLAADFTVTNGTLDIDEEVITSGNYEQTGGTLDVAVGKKFQAS